MIHSLDSIDLARRLDRLCVEEGRDKFSVLIQVDLGHEETKSGVEESELDRLVESFRQFSRLELIGLMTLPPFFDNPEESRPFFRRLREYETSWRREARLEIEKVNCQWNSSKRFRSSERRRWYAWALQSLANAPRGTDNT